MFVTFWQLSCEIIISWGNHANIILFGFKCTLSGTWSMFVVYSFYNSCKIWLSLIIISWNKDWIINWSKIWYILFHLFWLIWANRKRNSFFLFQFDSSIGKPWKFALFNGIIKIFHVFLNRDMPQMQRMYNTCHQTEGISPKLWNFCNFYLRC